MARILGMVDELASSWPTEEVENGGVVVNVDNLPSSADASTVVTSLFMAERYWRSQKKKVMWLKLPRTYYGKLLRPAHVVGFRMQHTEETYTMLFLRLEGDEPSALPTNAWNQVGAGPCVGPSATLQQVFDPGWCTSTPGYSGEVQLDPSLNFAKYTVLPFPDPDLFKDCLMAGDGGLFCINVGKSTGPEQLVVCNPLTHQVKVLPPLKYSRQPVLMHLRVVDGSGNYKILVAGSAAIGTEDVSLKTEEYDSKTGKWECPENSDLPCPAFGLDEYQNGVYVNVSGRELLLCVAIMDARGRGVLVYDLKEQKWVQGPTRFHIPLVRSEANIGYLATTQIVECGGSVFVFSEQECGREVYFLIHRLDVGASEEQAWEEIMRRKRSGGRGLLVYPEFTCVAVSEHELGIFNTVEHTLEIIDLTNPTEVAPLLPARSSEANRFHSLNPIGFAYRPSFRCPSNIEADDHGIEVINVLRPNQTRRRARTPDRNPARHTKRSRGKNWTYAQKLFLLKYRLLYQEHLKRTTCKPLDSTSWFDFVSKCYLAEHGTSIEPGKWQELMETVRKQFNAIRAYEEMVQSGTTACVSFWKPLNKDDRSLACRNGHKKLPRIFNHEMYRLVETIDQIPGADRQETRDGQAGALGESSSQAMTATISDPAGPSTGNRPSSFPHEGQGISPHPQGSQQLEGEKFDPPVDPLHQRSTASAFDEDPLFAKIAPFVNRSIDNAIQLAMQKLREDDEKRREQEATRAEDELNALRGEFPDVTIPLDLEWLSKDNDWLSKDNDWL